jgi:hypothetical protein
MGLATPHFGQSEPTLQSATTWECPRCNQGAEETWASAVEFEPADGGRVSHAPACLKCSESVLGHLFAMPSGAPTHFPVSRAGTPTTVAFPGISCVTTAPAPTIASAPIVTPHRITAPLPMEAPRRTTVGITCQSISV